MLTSFSLIGFTVARFANSLSISLQDGATALHVAAQEGRADVVRLLTEAQALLNIQRTVRSQTLCASCFDVIPKGCYLRTIIASYSIPFSAHKTLETKPSCSTV